MRLTHSYRRVLVSKSISLLLPLLLFAAGFSTVSLPAQSLPPGTTLPVRFTHTIEAGKAKSGDVVMAKTMQLVRLPDGQILPKDIEVAGHVVDSRPFIFDPEPYATRRPSYISVHFDRIAAQGVDIPLNVSVRALANTIAAYDASTPHYIDETDSRGTMVQIGGDQFSPVGKELLSSDGNIVGYIRGHGVFARLISNTYVSQYASFHCRSTNTEQSVAIFSPSACGLYGFDSIYMADNGRDGGAFRLESRRQTVKLYAGSAALLELNGHQP
jgi:hypothetical protein